MGNFCCNNEKNMSEVNQNDFTFFPLSKSKPPRNIHFSKSDFTIILTNPIYDDYIIKEKLGQGTFGYVYKALHRKTSIVRAIKEMKRKNIDEEIFKNEISILKSLDHPNIVRLFEVYCDEDNYYLVEEFCEGGNLYEYLKNQKNFTEKKAAIIMNQLFSALNHLHSKKYVHRDIKPENIVFVYTENYDIFIKLIDFGISVPMKSEFLTQELGTIFYVAPEVFKNKYNQKCDIWSCGVILYMMLSGQLPFQGNNWHEVKKELLKGEIDFSKNKIWEKISNEAKVFITSLLNLNSILRPNAQQALENDWIKKFKEDEGENIIDEKIIVKLTQFTSFLNIQKTVLGFIANHILQNDTIRKIKKEFDKIDINKDGQISKVELIMFLNKLFNIEVATEECLKIFEEIDFNNDGVINFSEFLTVNLRKENILKDEFLKNTFNQFDFDGDNFITIDDLKKTMNLNALSKVTWIDMMNEVDKDGDGKISFTEFKQVMLQLWNPENSLDVKSKKK